MNLKLWNENFDTCEFWNKSIENFEIFWHLNDEMFNRFIAPN